MSRNTNGGEVSKPPGPGEDTVDLAELLDGKVLEAGKRPSKRVTAGGSRTTTNANKSSYAEQIKSVRNPGAPSGHLGNMERSQYDGMISPSTYEKRMQQKTGFKPFTSESGTASKSGQSHPPTASQLRNQRETSTPPSRKSQLTTRFTSQGNTQKGKQSKIQIFANLQREATYGKRPTTQSSTMRSLGDKLAEHESNVKSMAPKSVRPNPAITENDLTMATKHSNYKTMTASERAKQDKWANDIFNLNTPCPDKYTWEQAGDGYQCKGGKHFITHGLVKELKQGLLIVPYGSPVKDPDGTRTKPNTDKSRGHIKVRWGPYYPHPDFTKIFMYSGPQDKPIPHGAPVVQGGEPDPKDASEPSEENRGQPMVKRLSLWLEFCAENDLDYTMELDNGSKGLAEIGPAKDEVLKQIVNERAKAMVSSRAASKATSRTSSALSESLSEAGKRAQSLRTSGSQRP